MGPALDLAAGTGDFVISLARQPNFSHLVGLDSTPAMLARARSKTQRGRLSHPVSLVVGDAHELPFADRHFVAIAVGFGIRNFADVEGAMREMVRVLRPGGRLAVLEIVRLPGRPPLKMLFPVYFRQVTPWLGAALAGDREAYTYLPQSVDGFRSADEVAEMMEAAGLRMVARRSRALGSVAILVGEKPGE